MLELLLFASSPFLALLGFFCIHRFKLEQVFASEKDFINIISRILGGIFGLFLAFCIVMGWGRYLEARRIVNQEITALSNLSRDTAPFPEDMRRSVHHVLTSYVRSVVEEEWPSMVRESQPGKITESRYQAIWSLYAAFTPENEKQKIFYQSSVNKLNELSTSRRQRLMYCRTAFITPLVAFLFFGCVVMIGISYCFAVHNAWLHALLIVVLAIIVCGGFYLAYELQDPFSGTIVISPEGFKDLLVSLEQRSGP
jgi:hypothetical protein